MGELYVHPHTLKHGLSEQDVRHAWRNAVASTVRICDDGREDVLAIGPDTHGRIVEMVAARDGVDMLVFHAMTPPTRRFRREMGIA